MINVITIIGARPQFIKSAVLSQAIELSNRNNTKKIAEKLIHTGQHYDFNMSGAFFNELDLKAPHYNLAISGGSHGEMTGRMLDEIERILIDEKPDMVVVFGDTNSTLAGALAASKLHIPVAHVESGLRSFNKRMPEEINRILTDHVSSILFCPTATAVTNLVNEGISEGVVNVGDVMYDAAKRYEKVAQAKVKLNKWRVEPKNYVLSTIHRAENTDEEQRLHNILSALKHVANDKPVVLPMHPRTKSKLMSLRISNLLESLIIIEPVSYLEMTMLEMNAFAIITDSGGVQKEAFFHRVPCLTVRDETEWGETVDLGWNEICGSEEKHIIDAWNSLPRQMRKDGSPFGDGKAGEHIVNGILSEFK
jgi:UDP-GlcNAc3NAcA epimerase